MEAVPLWYRRGTRLTYMSDPTGTLTWDRVSLQYRRGGSSLLAVVLEAVHFFKQEIISSVVVVVRSVVRCRRLGHCSVFLSKKSLVVAMARSL